MNFIIVLFLKPLPDTFANFYLAFVSLFVRIVLIFLSQNVLLQLWF